MHTRCRVKMYCTRMYSSMCVFLYFACFVCFCFRFWFVFVFGFSFLFFFVFVFRLCSSFLFFCFLFSVFCFSFFHDSRFAVVVARLVPFLSRTKYLLRVEIHSVFLTCPCVVPDDGRAATSEMCAEWSTRSASDATFCGSKATCLG